jgi:hypothetical protein
MTITQKVEQEDFDRIVAGDKRDLRIADGAAHTGDTLILEEWDPDAHAYTGRKLEAVVTAVRVLPAALEGASPESKDKRFDVIQFEPKESKYSSAS